MVCFFFFFFFKQKTAYEMCGRDWSSDVCSSDLTNLLSDTKYNLGAGQVFLESVSDIFFDSMGFQQDSRC